MVNAALPHTIVTEESCGLSRADPKIHYRDK